MLFPFQDYDNTEDVAGAYSVSFPRGFGYGPEDGEGDAASSPIAEHKPRILLMGLRRCI